MKEEGRTIGELVHPRSEKAHPKDFPNLAYVGLEHVEAHTMRILGSVPATEMRSTAKRFYSGDVLYSRLRPYLNKVWRADRDGLCSAEFIVMPGNDAIDADFLRYRLNAADFVSFANGLHAGDRPRVDFDQISSFILPPFSLSTQRSIVATIDQHFSRLEAGVTALRRVQANLKRYRAAVLKAACEGRLVPSEAELARTEGRTYETGEQLLARILADRCKNWHGRGKFKEPSVPDTTNLLPLPEGWAWATVEQLNLAGRPCAYGVLQPGDDIEGGVPFVRVGDISDGKVDQSNLKRITPSIAAKYPRTKLQGGELVITLVGAIGRAAIIPASLEGGNVARAVGVVPLALELDRHWVEIWFRNPQKVTEMTARSHEVARKTLNLEDVRAASVALPPVAEQIRIVAEVERRLSVIEELEASVAANLQRASRLRQSILQRAFGRER